MKNILEKLKIKSKEFPNSPGVYFFRDKKGFPIYIGRAGSLKKRIASYFRTADPRIKEMVFSANSLSYKKTSTLLEAVILEANLIKKYWPKYNVKEKDDRSFVYLVVTKGDFPKVLIVRGRDKDKYIHSEVKIFGPYQSYYLLRTALSLVRRIFPFSVCYPNSEKACFDYQIGLCPGACIGAISSGEYKKNITNLRLFFSGEKKKLLKKLKKENPEKIKALESVADAALLSGAGRSLDQAGGRIEGYDISHLSGKEPVGSMVVFEGNRKNSSEYRIFKIKNSNGEKNYDDIKMLKEVLSRRLNHREWQYPDIIFIDGGLNQVKAARSVLAEKGIFSIPIIGLAKKGGHSASAYLADKLIIANAKKGNRELLSASKRVFQEVRNEAHRFAISFSRRQRGKMII